MAMECGVFGYPLGHSISAVFQQAAFDSLGLAVSYSAWPVTPADFPARLRELRHQRFLGANVTIPHKEAALWGVDHADPVATAVGAVNTIARRGNELYGYNTDVPGFLDLLARDCGEGPRGESVLLLGAGGAARAVGLALLLAGAGRLVVANRSLDRGHQLGEHLASIPAATVLELRARLASHLPPRAALPQAPPGNSHGHVDARPAQGSGAPAGHAEATDLAPHIDVVAWHSDRFAVEAQRCRYIVNCTAAGMLGPHQDSSPLPSAVILRLDATVIDIVANPLQTRLMAWARMAGRRAVGGLPMLIYQGAEAFSIWTGREPPLGVMREAALDHMRRQAG